MENKIINYINQTPENTNPSVLATLLGELKVPKPLTYDYMPEGYPSKSVQTTTLIEEQEVAFTLTKNFYTALIASALELVVGQTYTVNWDGTEYECICSAINERVYQIGNASIKGAGDDTGEPFLCAHNTVHGGYQFYTHDTSASHTISVKKMGEIVTPMAEEFLPNIPADKLPTGGVTTLHINVTAINRETMEATFTADKTPAEMTQAAVNGPTWCVVSFAAGLMGEEAISIGVPPAWIGVEIAFGFAITRVHEDNGNNKIAYAVRQGPSNTWILDLTAFGS